MTDALDQLEYPKYLHKSVKDELKTHPLYKDNTRSLRIFNSKKTKVWEFHQQLEYAGQKTGRNLAQKVPASFWNFSGTK